MNQLSLLFLFLCLWSGGELIVFILFLPSADFTRDSLRIAPLHLHICEERSKHERLEKKKRRSDARINSRRWLLATGAYGRTRGATWLTVFANYMHVWLLAGIF